MVGTLDDDYLPWLYGQVDRVRARRSAKTYWNLLRQLYSTEFVWFVPNDDNRAEDGKELRFEWAKEIGYSPDNEWMGMPCSFFELLVGLARRLSFEAGEEPSVWFWRLLGNLDLLGCHDRSHYSQQEVENRLDTVIWRSYDPDGVGGLFPLRQAKEDQRLVELWYQMSSYILENE